LTLIGLVLLVPCRREPMDDRKPVPDTAILKIQACAKLPAWPNLVVP
jgi:hypothetical protein